MTTRLVTVLGIGNKDLPDRYSPTRYTWNGLEAPESPMVDVAIQYFFGYQSACAVSTETARAIWVGEDERFHRLSGLPLFVKTVPESSDESTAWETFQAFVDLLSAEAIVSAGETEPPSDIILNVTHGFRSLPMLALAAASFVESEWRRQGIDGPSLRVLYGAYTPGQAITPLWDLTNILNAARWNGAIDALIRFGRGDDLKTLGSKYSKAERARVDQQSLRGLTREEQTAKEQELGSARSLGERAAKLADDLALGRLSEVLKKSSVALHDSLSTVHTAALLKRIPVLTGAVEQLRSWTSELRADSVMTLEGVQSGVRVARLLGRMERFAEQAALLRELQSTLFHLASSREPLLEPGTPGIDAQRRVVDEAWGRLARDGAFKNASFPVNNSARLAAQLSQARNDIEHLGIRQSPMDAQKLRAELANMQKGMEAMVSSEGLGELENELSPALPLRPPVVDPYEAALEGLRRITEAGERTRLYETSIFPHSAARLFGARSEQPACKLLAVPVGTQPYAPLLVALSIRATHVALLHTDDVPRGDGSTAAGTRAFAHRVAASLAALPEEDRPIVELFSIGDGMTGTATLRAVEAAQFWAGDPWPSETTIDLTGGRKATTASLSAIATIKGCRQVYLEGRTIAPGVTTGEVLHTLSDLSSLAMADDRAAATALLEAGNYGAAAQRFGQICETLRAGDAAAWLHNLALLLQNASRSPAEADLRALASEVGSAGAASALVEGHESAAEMVTSFLFALRSEGLWR
jgi:CRISPR-associated protein Csx16